MTDPAFDRAGQCFDSARAKVDALLAQFAPTDTARTAPMPAPWATGIGARPPAPPAPRQRVTGGD